MKSVEEILDYLNSISNAKYKKNVIKMGIPEQCSLGVSTADIRRIAKSIEHSNDLFMKLWNTKIHEARLLGILIIDIKSFKQSLIFSLMKDVISWDLCDHLCKNLIIRLPNYSKYIYQWQNEDKLYFKRAAYCLIASSVIHDKNISTEELEQYLEIIEINSNESRIHVKKSITWALKEIGKKDYIFHERAINTAYNLCESPEKHKQWIGKNALKELEKLTSIKERKRLISKDSKMGKKIR